MKTSAIDTVSQKRLEWPHLGLLGFVWLVKKLFTHFFLTVFSLSLISASIQANPQASVINGATDLTANATYGTAPTGDDIIFTSGTVYSPTTFTISGGASISPGTLNDLTATALTINNGTAATTSILNLNGGTDSATGAAAADLLFVKSGSTLTLQNGTGTLTLALGAAGNLDVAGTATISTAITSGSGLTKTGAGTLTLGGASTFTGTTTVSGGVLALGAGTISNSAITVNAGAALQFVGSGTQSAKDGVISGAGGVQANFNNSNFAIVMNQANTYTGSTSFVTRSTLKAGVSTVYNAGTPISGPFGVNSALNLGSGGYDTVWLNGFNVEVGSLSGTSVNDIVLGQSVGTTGILTTGGDNTSTTLTSVISDGPVAGGANLVACNSTGGGVVKIGTGTQTFAGNNTYTGTTTVNGGTLQAGVASVAGVSGAFGNNSAISLANTAGVILDLNGFNTQIGSLTGGGTTGGNVTLGTATLTTGGDNTSPADYAGIISGTGSVTKIGTGTQGFSGANTFSGGTTISAGTLMVKNTSGSATGTGAVALNNGGTLGGGNGTWNAGSLNLLGTGANIPTLQTYTAGAAGLISGTVTAASGSTISPGLANAVGTLTVGGLTLQAGSTLNFEFNGTANDFISLTGNNTLTLNGGAFNLYQEGGVTAFSTAGTYDLIGYNGTVQGTGIGALSISNSVGGFTYTFVNDLTDNLIQLNIAAIPEPATWVLLSLGLGVFLTAAVRRRAVDQAHNS